MAAYGDYNWNEEDDADSMEIADYADEVESDSDEYGPNGFCTHCRGCVSGAYHDCEVEVHSYYEEMITSEEWDLDSVVPLALQYAY